MILTSLSFIPRNCSLVVAVELWKLYHYKNQKIFAAVQTHNSAWHNKKIGHNAAKSSTHQLNRKNTDAPAQNIDSLSPKSLANLHSIRII